MKAQNLTLVSSMNCFFFDRVQFIDSRPSTNEINKCGCQAEFQSCSEISTTSDINSIQLQGFTFLKHICQFIT